MIFGPDTTAIADQAKNPAPITGATLPPALQHSRVSAIIAELAIIDGRIQAGSQETVDLDRAVDLIHEIKQYVTADGIRIELLREKATARYAKPAALFRSAAVCQ